MEVKNVFSICEYYSFFVDDLWDADSYRCVSLGSKPVQTLLVLDDSVWASCGNSVTVMDISSLTTQVNNRACKKT